MPDTSKGNPTSVSQGMQEQIQRLEQLLQDDHFWHQQDQRIAQHQDQQARQRAAYRAARQQRRWEEIPATYREEFLPSKSQLPESLIAIVRGWTPDESQGQGIGLIGHTGLGKTRLLVRLLHYLDCSWRFIPATRYAAAVRQQYDDDWATARDAHQQLIDARQVHVLHLDDLGQESATPSVSEALLDLIEHRTSHRLPILWTSNLTPAQLSEKHGPRGPALLRRLQENTYIHQ